MKRLNKLQINPEKVLKNEELLTLKGGYGGSSCCVCLNGSGSVMGYMAAGNQSQCSSNCSSLGWTGTYGSWSYC